MSNIVALGKLKHAIDSDRQIAALSINNVRQFHRTHSPEFIFSVIASLERLETRLTERWDAINVLIEQEKIEGESGEQDCQAPQRVVQNMPANDGTDQA